ncbi:MAG TPA: hypothetical protein VN717_11255 [Gemmatimonadaceae bacterium]|nr:hypothetical protein [Gemmatimonadaceae bacterium]
MDRHLLPEEIDLLLDGEVGFGTPPLKAHVRSCVTCSRELESARVLVRTLEHLPHIAPSPLFAGRVMSRVQLFVPWHVALLDTVRGLIPQSRPLRVAAGALFATMAIALTALSVWAFTRIDAVLFTADLVVDRARSAAFGALGGALSALLGDAARPLLTGGALGLAAAALLLVVTGAAAATMLRAAAVRARER